MITVIDYGMGNMGSILNMLKRTGHEAVVASDPKKIETATKLILPGVGAFDAGMIHLNESGLRDVIEQRVVTGKIPILGICLGMQLLFERSEEGKEPGLAWLAGKVKKFNFEGEGGKLRVPHMGWNKVTARNDSKMFFELEEDARFYFVHSYYLTECEEEVIAGETEYGIDFTCAVEADHIWGAQFHPEKSHHYGTKLLTNFVNS